MIHFTSGDYLHIRDDRYLLMVKMDSQSPQEAARAHYLDNLRKMARIQKQQIRLENFLKGNTDQSPDALKLTTQETL